MSKLNQLKTADTDRAKVERWLDHIKEFDQECRTEVLNQCAKDKEARAYYVKRSNEISANNIA